jgi:hypothetical protein
MTGPNLLGQQESRAKRAAGVVASADLLPLDAYIIPEKRLQPFLTA